MLLTTESLALSTIFSILNIAINKGATMKAEKKIEMSHKTKVQLKSRSRPPLPQASGTPKTLSDFESNRSENAVSYECGQFSTKRTALIALSAKQPTEVGMHPSCVHQMSKR